MDNVLIVDGDPIKLEEIQRYLIQLSQFDVITVSNEKETRYRLKNKPVSVIVLDLDTPDMDFLGLLVHINRHHSNAPCIITSQLPIPVFLDHDDDETVLRYLKKPYDLSKLAIEIFDALVMKDEGLVYCGISVRSLLPLMEMKKISGCLKIHSNSDQLGELHFLNGRLLDAISGDLQGEEAARKLIGLCRIDMTFEPTSKDYAYGNIEDD